MDFPASHVVSFPVGGVGEWKKPWYFHQSIMVHLFPYTTVDGSEIRETHQLRLVVEIPLSMMVSAPSERWLGMGFQPSTVSAGFVQ